MTSSKLKSVCVALAIILVSTLLLHAVIPHDHPEEIFGYGMQTVMHSQDKKWWLVVILVSLLIATAVFSTRTTFSEILTRIKSSFKSSFLMIDLSQLFDPLRIAFRRGILHSKICE